MTYFFPKQPDDFYELPTFQFKFDALKNLEKPLTLSTTRHRRSEKQQQQQSTVMCDSRQDAVANQNTVGGIVTYTDDELEKFKDNMVAKNTKKSTFCAVRRLKAWYEEKHGQQIDLDQVSKQNAPELLKHFFIEIRQTSNNSKGKEYEPGTLQTYRNGLRRYFLERPCPPAIDNFDLDKTGSAEFEEVATMLSLKKKDLKKKGLGNKPNAADPVEAEDLEKMWSSGAVGLQNPRSLIRLVWWNNVTHLGMRACKEQHDCQLEDFVVRDQYIEYTERQTKNRQGDEGKAKRARKYNNKLWKTDGGERDPYRAFMEYVSHRPKGDDVPNNFYLTPIDNTTSDVWYKSIPIGVNTLSKMMKQIADKAGLKGKFTNSSGRKTTVQLLRDEFHPLEISELTGHANPESITSYSHNPLEKQRQMSNTLSGFRNPSSSTVAVSVGQSSMPMPMAPQPQARDHAVPRFDSSGFLAGAVSGLFTEASFNNSPVNIAINLHASVNPSS